MLSMKPHSPLALALSLTAIGAGVLRSEEVGRGDSARPPTISARPHSSNSNDDSMLAGAYVILGKVKDLAKAKGMQDAPDVGGLGKTAFYPDLGRAANLKSFQIYAAEKPERSKPLYWWVKISSLDARLHQVDFVPPYVPSVTPHEAKWSRSQAVEIGKEFMSILGKIVTPALRLEVSEFRQHKQLDSKGDVVYVNGYWYFEYQRYTDNGYRIFDDSVLLELDERYGLRLFVDNCLTEIDGAKVDVPSITQEEAKKLAVEHANKVFANSPAIRGHYSEFVLSPTPTQQILAVVRPNDLLTCKDFHLFKEQRYGALAWMFAFVLTHRDGKLYPGVLKIYIDAKTGAFLGGSA